MQFLRNGCNDQGAVGTERTLENCLLSCNPSLLFLSHAQQDYLSVTETVVMT